VLPPLPKSDLSRYIKTRLPGHLVDETGGQANTFAIYTLADPRDLRRVRYVGQTRSPRRRFMQHLQTARLWLPEEVPWWFASPKLRPLYDWIRELHREEYRLPVMLITGYADSVRAARVAEREAILRHLAADQELLNVEREILERQLGLPL
jgi:hypothetical protein